MNPKIDADLPPRGEEAITIGKTYTILLAETFVSEVSKYKGIRVTLEAGLDDVLAIPLWLGDVVSRNSKLGAFISLLGDNTDEWLNKQIQFVQWEPKHREIKVVGEFKVKSPKRPK